MMQVSPEVLEDPACPRVLNKMQKHGRTSWVVWCRLQACAELGKAIIFRANAKFFGQKPAAKNEKYIFFVFIKQKNGIHSVQRDEVPKVWDFY